MDRSLIAGFTPAPRTPQEGEKTLAAPMAMPDGQEIARCGSDQQMFGAKQQIPHEEQSY